MRVEQEQVRQFHRKYKFPAPDAPTIGELPLRLNRFQLMREELEEYLDACDEADLVKVADAIADLAYTVVGTAVAHGLDLQPLFAEVHRSNMTKDVGAFKPVKGHAFQPPRLAEEVLRQRHPAGVLLDRPDTGADVPGGGAA